jgi:ElaB/YqjD/DUF883 family membrane-anchored ribosome-binding protein
MRADLEYITSVLDEVEKMVEGSSRVPMNRARAMVDRSDMLVLVKELRDSLPREREEAKAVHRERESILASGREEAERIVQNARQRSQEMVADSETYRRSQRWANENLDGAERYSEEVSRGSEAYREQVMAQIERWFGESLDSVAESRKEFESRELPEPRSGEQDPLDDTQPQERQEPVIEDREDREDREDGGRSGWRASSA